VSRAGDTIDVGALPPKPQVDRRAESSRDRSHHIDGGAAQTTSLEAAHCFSAEAGAAGNVGLAQVLADAEHAEGAAKPDIVHRRMVADRALLTLMRHFVRVLSRVGIGRVAMMVVLILDVSTVIQRTFPGVDSCPR